MSDQNDDQNKQPDAGKQPPTPKQDAPAGGPAEKPPWGDDKDFDASKAWNLIQGLKADKEKLSAREVLTDEAKSKLAEYDKLVEASKTELERAQEAAAKLAPLESQNLRLQVALEKGLTGDRADLVARLQGSNREELAADADKLLALLAPATPAGPATPQAPKPNPAQGASGGAAPTPAAQAAEATAAGDWRKAIGHKSAQLIAIRDQQTN